MGSREPAIITAVWWTFEREGEGEGGKMINKIPGL